MQLRQDGLEAEKVARLAEHQRKLELDMMRTADAESADMFVPPLDKSDEEVRKAKSMAARWLQVAAR